MPDGKCGTNAKTHLIIWQCSYIIAANAYWSRCLMENDGNVGSRSHTGPVAAHTPYALVSFVSVNETYTLFN